MERTLWKTKLFNKEFSNIENTLQLRFSRKSYIGRDEILDKKYSLHYAILRSFDSLFFSL